PARQVFRLRGCRGAANSHLAAAAAAASKTKTTTATTPAAAASKTKTTTATTPTAAAAAETKTTTTATPPTTAAAAETKTTTTKAATPPTPPTTAASPDVHWPDGTPKKFRGKENWKNWINWESPFRDETDELNRQRHFFWEVDEKGALWRLELDQPGKRFGQMRFPKVLDDFFGHLQRNDSGVFQEAFPFVSLRTHEHYFLRWAAGGPSRESVEAPIVFNDLRDGELRSVTAGEIASSITTRFDPAALRLTADGRLLHPVWTTARSGKTEQGPEARGRQRVCFFAALDASTAQTVLEEFCRESDGNSEGDCDTAPSLGQPRKSGFVLCWEGSETALLLLEVSGQEEGPTM
ncbi:unnamed protein product, partial [Polarella glacialis]